MSSEIENLLHRPKAYNNIDGVGELSTGAMIAGFGLLGWMQVHTPRDSAWNTMYTLFIFVGVMCAAIHYGTKAIKERITYPRTGFVQYRRRETLWLPLLLGCGISALISAGLSIAARSHWNLETPAALVGLVLAASYAYGFARTVRWKWSVAVAMAFTSLILAILPAEQVGSLAGDSWIIAEVPAKVVGVSLLIFPLYGAMLLISGAISFWLYLRHAPAPAGDEE
jgi:hypothetical protein